MPVRPNHPLADPQLRQQKKKHSPVGIIVLSVVMVVLMMFSTGKLPAADHILGSLNDLLQQRNDEIVASLVNYVPYLLIGGGLLSILFLLFNRAPSKKKA